LRTEHTQLSFKHHGSLGGRRAGRRHHQAIRHLRKEIVQDVYKREGAAALAPDNFESSDAASRKSGPVLCSETLSVIGDKMSRATVASP
jgi:hypothetical protein